MRNFNRNLTSSWFLLVLVLACTKDIKLKTEVEFSLTEQHKEQGYVNEGLPTTVTVAPEEILEEFSYSYSYSIAKGEGYFRNNTGELFPQGENIALHPFSASMIYVGSKPGEHIVTVTATDNYGFTEEIEIDYDLVETPPIIWTATSPVQRMLLGNQALITVTFENSGAYPDTNFERRYRLTTGSGRLIDPSEQAEIDQHEFKTILPGTYTLNFTPDELGIMILSFDLRDDYDNEFTAKLTFEVLEEIIDDVAPEIDLIGDNPLTVERGSNYIELGATASDDVDGDISENISIDGSDVNTSVVGTYEVLYNVSDRAENAASEVIRIVEVIAGDDPRSAENDVIAFALPGQQETADIDKIKNTVIVHVPFGTDLNVAPIALSVSPNAMVIPSATAQQNFENPVTYTVTAENGNEQEWVVMVMVAESNEKAIEKFTINGLVGAITETEVTVTLPAGTDASALTPQIEFIGASIEPSLLTTVDLTNSVIYTVTAQDGSTKEYSVTVDVEQSTEKEITSFAIEGIAGVFSGPEITVTLPSGTDASSLSPEIDHTGQLINPPSGTVRDFSNPVWYTVTAEDGSQKTYTIKVLITNDPPISSARANLTKIREGLPVSLNGANSTDDIGIVEYLWDFGDGNTDASPNPVHVYNVPGNYNASLTVTDDGGLTDTASVLIEVSPNGRPTAVATTDKTNGVAPLKVNFTGSNSVDPDNDPLSYEWQFGPTGAISTAPNSSYTYSTPGTYNLTLTVSDGDLMHTVSLSIQVRPATTFNPDTGLYTAPPGSRVTIGLNSGGTGKGSASVKAGSLSLSTGWNGLEDESASDSDSGNFTMPPNGQIYFTGSHREIFGSSNSNVNIINDQGPQQGFFMDKDQKIPR